MIEINKIYNINCLEGMKLIEDESIDLILCDLPYGTTVCSWDTIIPFNLLWEQYERIINDNGVIILTATQPFTSKLILSNLKLFKYELIWDKMLCKNPGLAKIRPLPAHESICIFGKSKTCYNPQFTIGKKYRDIRKKAGNILNKNEHKYGFAGNIINVINNGNRYPVSVLQFMYVNQPHQHPTQKPVELFKYLIKTYTNENDLILDNCIGSGTTAIAALETNRNFIGFELKKEYFDIANNRIKDWQNQMRF